MKILVRLLTLGLVIAMFGCDGLSGSSSPAVSGEPADLIFLGEHILTVDSGTDGATAVAVRDDTIVAVGDRSDVEGLIADATRVVELGDRALTPGFIDAHGHLAMAMAYADLLNASSPPVGPMESVEDIVRALRDRIEEQAIPAGGIVAGYGYDDSLLAENRHPDRDDLDRASTDHSIVLIHVSGHLATANSKALELFGYRDGSPDPPGGVIRRRPGTQIPNGVLEETASSGPLYALLAGPITPEDYARQVFAAIRYNTQYGITTIQDGATSPQAVAGLRALAAQRPLPVDVAAYVTGNAMEADLPIDSIGFTRTYENGVRIAGVKFVLDGSPQGRTAWLTEPYAEGPSGADSDYVAYPIVDPEQYRFHAKRLIQAGIPIIAHANGDAAIDLMIDGVAGAIGDARPDHRSVTIHSQVTRKDQLDRMKELRIVPSFFASHCFFWGDWHRKSFGDDRALGISPLRSALERGIDFTIHNDAPVVPPHIMRLLEAAVDRRTRSGFVLGEDERISVEQALHAVTLGAAYGYFEEDRKGSISVGKQADLVVLAADPREVPVEEISEVAVLETIARGQTVYRAEAEGRL
ncbi:MAG: amidohydrolase [Deltaproteobacteria bacterium]|nr:amidohydrolase [Deltaproteobacteria bacterium]